MLRLRIITILLLFIFRLRFPKTRSIADVIEKTYGKAAVRSYRKFGKLDFKRRKTELDISFLETCKENDIIPKFCVFKTANRNLQNSETYKQCQQKLLLEEIKIKMKRKKSLDAEYTQKEKELAGILRYLDYVHITNLSSKGNIASINKIEVIQNKKLLELISHKKGHDPDQVIYNYSSHILTEHEKTLLAKGLNFALPPKKLKFDQHLLPFELLYRDIRNLDLPNDKLMFLKSKIQDIGLSSFRMYNKKEHKFDNISQNEYVAFLNLIENKEIIIQKADKGNNTVILNKQDYIEKINEILGDNTKFEKALFENKDNKELRYLLNMEEAIKITLKDLLEQKRITKLDYEKLVPIGSQPGILYGCTKIHKKVIGKCPPLRPILNAINTPNYQISKYLVPILASLTSNNYTVNDSFSFANEIRTRKSNYFMASLDIDSLFTNIPLDETIEICINLLFENKEEINGLNKSQLKTLITLATKQSFFLFNNEFYCQKDGVSMGSPLGPTLANIFLCYYEKKWLEECPEKIRPIFYKRYVDDIFILCDNENQVEQFQKYLNNKHKNMSFTFELEKQNQLAFLDINIIRENTSETFKTSLYRKPTFSGVYTNFKSFIAIKYKYSLISSLLFRVFAICSDYTLISEEIERLKIIWLKNAYPIRVIDKIIYKFFDKLFLTKKVVHTVGKKELFISLDYIGKQSILLKNRLQQIVKEQLPFCKINVIFTSKNKLTNFFTFKDRVPRNLKSRVLYKYSCSSCNTTYIGKSLRHFQVRYSEHLGISKLTNKAYTYNKKTSTTVRDHIHNCKHEGTPENFKIIGSAKNDYHLKIKESLNILREKPELNKTVKSFPLYLF